MPWVSSGMSATSSSSSVPPCARSSTPARRGCAAGSAPASTPNNSSSNRAGAIVAQFITMNGPSARRELAWIIRATTSLPDPAGPVIKTRDPVGATLSTWPRTCPMPEESPISPSFGSGPQPQFGVLTGQRRRLQGAPHHQQQTIRLKRLLDEIVSAVLDRTDRHLDRAMAGNHDHRNLRFLAVEQFQQADAVQPGALQPDIQHHQRRPPGVERGQSGIRRLRRRGFRSPHPPGCRRSAS